MLIARRPESAHWYLPDGMAFYEVPNVSRGGMRPVKITDAFKVGAYRSVTNVLDVLAKPGLVRWKVEQAILSALTLPRIDGETEHDFAERALADSEEQARKAAEAGTVLHDVAANYLTTGNAPVGGSSAYLLGPFFAWAKANILRVVASEVVVLNHAHHYAGRLDVAVQLMDGTHAILDLKTQDVKTDAKGEPKPSFYETWPMQLAAYANCPIPDDFGPSVSAEQWRLFSLVIGRERPGCYAHEWERNESHFRAFVAACECWSYAKGGTPGLDKKAA